MRIRFVALLLVLLITAACPAAGPPSRGALTVYSGRSEELVGELIERFEASSGYEVEVRYGDTAQLTATLLEEGDDSPADVILAQDAGALGALADADRLTALPDDLLELVDVRFRSRDGLWVGTSGRARVLVYGTEAVEPGEVPTSVFDLTDERWRGRVGWAPTNASFQAFVTAMRVVEGDDRTREWLEAMVTNDVEEYASNLPIVDAVARGEIDLGLANHYYLYTMLEEDPDLPAANAFLTDDIGGLVNVAGVAILDSAGERAPAGEELARFLLSEDAQRYFAEDTFEYPLIEGVPADRRLPELTSLDPPDVDLSDLDDLGGTLDLLREVGALG